MMDNLSFIVLSDSIGVGNALQHFHVTCILTRAETVSQLISKENHRQVDDETNNKPAITLADPISRALKEIAWRK
jgi:hypothetical protein